MRSSVKFLYAIFANIQMATPMEGIPDNVDSGSVPKPSVIYRCKKCRRIVATEEYIIPHNRGEGQKCFRGKWKNDPEMEAPTDCSSIFVEPMKWMQTRKTLYLTPPKFLSLSWRKVTWETSFNVSVARLDWARSVGWACSAVVGGGLIPHFSFTKAVWMSVVFKRLRSRFSFHLIDSEGIRGDL
ncbi:dual specificity protein phosphatase-related [Striga asiatica]|uniref:Dual specificity protein phosphatase-related n=1 Tax=Striga asiatica TaxID=4170 RepID=A0A5A7PFY8_STRAF|nr:dual specificity protein phosphatase-related [Striga asiatica]